MFVRSSGSFLDTGGVICHCKFSEHRRWKYNVIFFSGNLFSAIKKCPTLITDVILRAPDATRCSREGRSIRGAPQTAACVCRVPWRTCMDGPRRTGQLGGIRRCCANLSCFRAASKGLLFLGLHYRITAMVRHRACINHGPPPPPGIGCLAHTSIDSKARE